jgi:hypothetical protein
MKVSEKSYMLDLSGAESPVPILSLFSIRHNRRKNYIKDTRHTILDQDFVIAQRRLRLPPLQGFLHQLKDGTRSTGSSSLNDLVCNVRKAAALKLTHNAIRCAIKSIAGNQIMFT